MKLILKKDIKGLGRFGEVVQSSDGYGRNYLLPRGFAEIATPQTLARARAEAELRLAQEEKVKSEAKKAPEKLAGREFIFALPADEKGNLYAGLKDAEILAKIRKSAGKDIPNAELAGYLPIKKIGEYKVKVRFSPETIAEIKISVTSNNASKIENF